jgi:hypothetical protein
MLRAALYSPATSQCNGFFFEQKKIKEIKAINIIAKAKGRSPFVGGGGSVYGEECGRGGAPW